MKIIQNNIFIIYLFFWLNFIIRFVFFILVIFVLIKCDYDYKYDNYNNKIIVGVSELPKIECYDLFGKKEIISHREGEILILNFWGINCTPCINEIPGFNKLVKKYEKNKMIRFIALTSCYTKLDKLKLFLEKNKFNFEQKLVEEKYIKILKLNAIPTTIICNQNGIIVYYIIGGGPVMYKYIDKIIYTLLNGGILCI